MNIPVEFEDDQSCEINFLDLDQDSMIVREDEKDGQLDIDEMSHDGPMIESPQSLNYCGNQEAIAKPSDMDYIEEILKSKMQDETADE